MLTAPYPLTDDRLIRYTVALDVVTQIDEQLNRGVHFRDWEGRVLLNLDEVIHACLTDQLAPLPHRAGWLMEADYLRWMDTP